MKLIMENWKNFIREAIVDVPTDKLSDVFDDKGVLSDKIVSVINDAKTKIQNFLDSTYKGHQITEMFVVGAAVTYQFSPTSDIDISVVIPQMDVKTQRKPIANWMEQNLIYNIWSVNGSERPFQFKPIKSNDNYNNADAAYDPFSKTWLKKPDLTRSKEEYNKYIVNPESKERKMYTFVEKHLQPSLERLLHGLNNTKLNDNVSDNIKKLMEDAYKRYKLMKGKRGSAYTSDPKTTGLISQNWGTGNVVYKFMAKEGYNAIYELLEKIIKGDLNINQEIINTLKEQLQKVLTSEHGFNVSESKKNR